ncbi:MAG: hypothetical protein LQ340_004702, partial [Diploschistes diacapsis]
MSSGLTYERRKELNGICTQLGIDSLRIHAYSDEDLDELREKALKIKAGTVFSYHAHQAIGVAHNWSLSRIPFCLEWKHHILDQELSYHHLDSVVEFDPKSPGRAAAISFAKAREDVRTQQKLLTRHKENFDSEAANSLQVSQFDSEFLKTLELSKREAEINRNDEFFLGYLQERGVSKETLSEIDLEDTQMLIGGINAGVLHEAAFAVTWKSFHADKRLQDSIALARKKATAKKKKRERVKLRKKVQTTDVSEGKFVAEVEQSDSLTAPSEQDKDSSLSTASSSAGGKEARSLQEEPENVTNGKVQKEGQVDNRYKELDFLSAIGSYQDHSVGSKVTADYSSEGSIQQERTASNEKAVKGSVQGLVDQESKLRHGNTTASDEEIRPDKSAIEKQLRKQGKKEKKLRRKIAKAAENGRVTADTEVVAEKIDKPANTLVLLGAADDGTTAPASTSAIEQVDFSQVPDSEDISVEAAPKLTDWDEVTRQTQATKLNEDSLSNATVVSATEKLSSTEQSLEQKLDIREGERTWAQIVAGNNQSQQGLQSFAEKTLIISQGRFDNSNILPAILSQPRTLEIAYIPSSSSATSLASTNSSRASFLALPQRTKQVSEVLDHNNDTEDSMAPGIASATLNLPAIAEIPDDIELSSTGKSQLQTSATMLQITQQTIKHLTSKCTVESSSSGMDPELTPGSPRRAPVSVSEDWNLKFTRGTTTLDKNLASEASSEELTPKASLSPASVQRLQPEDSQIQSMSPLPLQTIVSEEGQRIATSTGIGQSYDLKITAINNVQSDSRSSSGTSIPPIASTGKVNVEILHSSEAQINPLKTQLLNRRSKSHSDLSILTEAGTLQNIARKIDKLQSTTTYDELDPTSLLHSKNGVSREDHTYTTWAQDIPWRYLETDEDVATITFPPGTLAWRRPMTWRPLPQQSHPREVFGAPDAPAIIQESDSGTDAPIVMFHPSLQLFLVRPAAQAAFDALRSDTSHPDCLPNRKLREYQAAELLDFEVWRSDRAILSCRRSGCKKVGLLDHQTDTVICLGCGPMSLVRYCSRRHQLEDLADHLRECGHPRLLIPDDCWVDEDAFPPRYRNATASIKDRCGIDNVFKARQRLQSQWNGGAYTLFRRAGGDLPFVVRFAMPPPPSSAGLFPAAATLTRPNLAPRAERLLNIALGDERQKGLIRYLYQLLRLGLRQALPDSMSKVEQVLRHQFLAEFGFDAAKCGKIVWVSPPPPPASIPAPAAASSSSSPAFSPTRGPAAALSKSARLRQKGKKRLHFAQQKQKQLRPSVTSPPLSLPPRPQLVYDQLPIPSDDPCECLFLGSVAFENPKTVLCNPTCRARRAHVESQVGLIFNGPGLGAQVQGLEARDWLLRAWHRLHPSVRDWRKRMLGLGFPGVHYEDFVSLEPVRGPGWDGRGSRGE